MSKEEIKNVFLGMKLSKKESEMIKGGDGPLLLPLPWCPGGACKDCITSSCKVCITAQCLSCTSANCVTRDKDTGVPKPDLDLK
jgi:hypothetical protein